MILEASIYALKKLPAEERAAYGLPVLTMRRWPQGIRKTDIGLWMPSAGPSIGLLVDLQLKKISWSDFAQAYRQEQEMQTCCQVITYHDAGRRLQQAIPCRSIDHLHFLEQQRGTITLLCWEQHERCHRYLLQKLLDERKKG